MDLSQESFDALLKWLDNDRDEAGQKYETIRQGLIRIYRSHGISDAEKWTDITITRVAGKIPIHYKGDPFRYFVGFARNIIHEALREPEIPTDEFPELSTEPPEPDERYDCLIQSLKFFPKKDRDLIRDYYAYSGHNKIEVHQQMAEERGISKGALRNRVFQISSKLQKAVLQCMAERNRNKNRDKNHRE